MFKAGIESWISFNILLNSSIESPKWTGLLISVSVFFISISCNFSVKNVLV